MGNFFFDIMAEDGPARTGLIKTPHGLIKTPAFVPVATQAAVKSLSGAHFSGLGIQVLMTNAYHLHLQPGEKVIRQLGGLHHFMGWPGPLMMDSGGFQVFSLGLAKEKGGGKRGQPPIKNRFPGTPGGKGPKPLVRISEEGVQFISYRDGSPHSFTPERVVQMGCNLGIDLMMALDECTSPHHDYGQTRDSMDRTHRWALRALEEFQRHTPNGRSLFGIVQGGAFQDLREKSARFMAQQPFDGYAIGGFLGTSADEMTRILQWTIPYFPNTRPRHFLGIGLVEDIFEMVRFGIDLFDCIAPTLLASTGTLLTRQDKRFRLRILNQRHKEDSRPVAQDCQCYTCRNHSRAYLRHLFLAKEPLGVILATLHNLHFMESLLIEIREAIEEGRFELFRRSWLGEKNAE